MVSCWCSDLGETNCNTRNWRKCPSRLCGKADCGQRHAYKNKCRTVCLHCNSSEHPSSHCSVTKCKNCGVVHRLDKICKLEDLDNLRNVSAHSSLALDISGDEIEDSVRVQTKTEKEMIAEYL